MVQTLTLHLLRDIWLMHEPSVQLYATAARDYLSGKEVSTGFFSSLELPDVPGNIALVPIVGALTKANICGAEGSRSLAAQVQKAAANKSIEAIIVLSENCPGGQVDGTQEFADAIKMARLRKPVLGAVSGICCSAGVWILSQTDEVYATSDTDLIGCIGVMTRMKNPKKVDAENDDIIEVISDLTPDKNAEFKDVQKLKDQHLNPLAKLFQENVKAGRGERLKLSTEDVLSGKTYVAGQAHQFGLIDGIMSFNKIVARANFLSKKRK